MIMKSCCASFLSMDVHAPIYKIVGFEPFPFEFLEMHWLSEEAPTGLHFKNV